MWLLTAGRKCTEFMAPEKEQEAAPLIHSTIFAKGEAAATAVVLIGAAGCTPYVAAQLFARGTGATLQPGGAEVQVSGVAYLKGVSQKSPEPRFLFCKQPLFIQPNPPPPPISFGVLQGRPSPSNLIGAPCPAEAFTYKARHFPKRIPAGPPLLGSQQSQAFG